MVSTLNQIFLNEVQRLLPSGTGVVPIANVRQVLNDLISDIGVLSPTIPLALFSPKGDGVSDDFPAFDAASNVLQAAGGGTLSIPPGRFLTSSGSISPPSNTIFQGTGADSTVILNNVATFPSDQTVSIYGTMTGDKAGWPGSNTTYPCNAPTIGTNTVTTTVAADAGNFPAGTIIFISGGLHGTSFWYPGWFTTVKTTNPGTGVITLDETLPFGGSQITTIQKILSLKQNIAIRDMTIQSAKASVIGAFVAKNILIQNVRGIAGVFGVATGPGATLGVCRNSMFRAVRMEQGVGPLELFVASDSYIEGSHLTNSCIVVDGGSFDCGVLNNYIKDPQERGVDAHAILLAEYGQRLRAIGNTITGVPDGFAGISCPASPDANRYYSIIGNDISGAAYVAGNTGINGAFAVCDGNHLANLQTGIAPDNNAPVSWGINTFDNVLHKITNDGLFGANTNWRTRMAGGLKNMQTATAIPSVIGAGVYQLFNAAPQTITNFSGAEIGDEITIFVADGNTTFQQSGVLQLKGAVDYHPIANVTMKFLMTAGGPNWTEVSRSA